MLPVILALGPIRIYSFGLLLFLAVVVGMFVSWKKISEYHIEDQRFLDIAFLTVFWGLIGARALYIVENFSLFGFNLLKWLWFTHFVGLSMWGAIVFGVGGMIFFINKDKEDVFEWLDIGSLGLSLGLAVGRLGALLNGSSVGVPFAFGVNVAGQTARVLPIQIIEALVLFVLFVWLWRVERKFRTIGWYRGNKSSAKSGFLFFMFLIVFGLLMISTSFGYSGAKMLLGVSQQIWWGGGCLLSGIVGLYSRSGRSLSQDFKFNWRKNKK